MATPAIREELALLYMSKALYVTLHKGDPGLTGANEVTPITRQPLTWTAGAVDGVLVAAHVTFTVPANTEVTHVGIWGSLTGGTFIDSQPCALYYTSAGEYGMTLRYVQS